MFRAERGPIKAGMPEILAYVNRADEDPALDRRVRFGTRPGALAGLQAYRVHNAAEGGPPPLACAVADVRYLIDNGLLAMRWPHIEITPAGKAQVGRARM